MHVMDLPKTKGLPRNCSFLMCFSNAQILRWHTKTMSVVENAFRLQITIK